MQFKLGWFAEAVFVTGNYPRIMREQIANKSAAQGVPDRLPGFTAEESDKIQGNTTLKNDVHV